MTVGSVDVRVVVLGGGPDAERGVSLVSAAAVAEALGEPMVEIDRLTPAQLAGLPGGVIFPALHGRWGEGGPLQDLLEADGRAYVGSGPLAARTAMDKVATKLIAAGLGIHTPNAAMLDPHAADAGGRPPIPLPAVVKPVLDGSSFGVHICNQLGSDSQSGPGTWLAAWNAVRQDADRLWMIERLIPGRELTVGVLSNEHGMLRAMPIVEIRPAEGLYDHAAKYTRSDTRYIVAPNLSAHARDTMTAAAVEVCRAIGVRHLARVDFMLGTDDEPMMLEVNTMPGFTPTSLLPKACAADGIAFADLCRLLVRRAIADHAAGSGRDSAQSAVARPAPDGPASESRLQEGARG